MSDNEIQAKGVLIWIICALFFLYEFFLRTIIGAYQSPLMHDLNLTSFQFSMISTTIFLFIYGVMQIPVGLIVDNLGLKKSLLLGTVFCMLSCFGFAYSYAYPMAAGFRLLMGLGSSFAFVCLLISVHEWMPHKYSAIFIGLSQFIGTLGPMLAAGPLETLSESSNIDWRHIFYFMGAVGFVFVVLVLLFVENNYEKSGKYVVLHKPERISVSIKKLFFRMQPWCIAIISATLYFSLEYLSENEGRAFLKLKGISLNDAGYMLTVGWLGYAIGSPLLGFISDFIERRKVVLVFCSCMSIVSIIGIVYFSNKLFLQVMFFMLGVSTSGQGIGFVLISEQFKKQFVAIGFGLNNMMIMTLSAVNAPFLGILLDYKSGGRSFVLGDYSSVFSILVLMSIIAFVFSIFFLKETFCKSAVDFTVLKKRKSR